MNATLSPLLRAGKSLPICAALLLLFGQVAHAQTLTRWRRDARGAFSITFDDNLARQLTNVKPLLNSRGIQATWFVPDPARQTNLALLRAAALEGHEIASHSLSHADLSQMDSAAVQYDLSRSRHLIDSLIPSQRCVSFAYPFCILSDLIARIAGRIYLASRTCGGIYVTAPSPADFQRIVAVGYGNDLVYGPTLGSGVLNGYVDECISRRGWVTTYCHDFDASGSGWVSSDTFATHLDYITSKGEQVFCAPFGVVTRYIRQRQCASFAIIADNGTSRTYTLSDTLSDNTLYNLPLTATLKLPDTWQSASVTQNGSLCWSIIRNDTLVFESVPDAGAITIIGSLSAIAPVGPRPARATIRAAESGVFLLDGRRAGTAPVTGLSHEITRVRFLSSDE